MFVVLLPEYQYLQLVARFGPLTVPHGGPDRVSVQYLLEKGLVEVIGDQVAATLTGAVISAASPRLVDDNAAVFELTLFDSSVRRAMFNDRASEESATRVLKWRTEPCGSSDAFERSPVE